VRTITWMLCCSLLARSVRAEGGTEADRLFEEGRALAKAGQYAEACDRFAQSLAIDRTIGTELNLGDCHEQLGHLREAWDQYTGAVTDAEAAHDDKRTAFARERLRGVEAKMTTLIIRVADPERAGLALTIDGRAVSPANELREHVTPGPIEIEETAPALAPIRRREVGGAGMTLVIELPAVGAAEQASQVQVAPALEVPGPRNVARTRISYGLAAIGAGSAITALTLTLVARSHYRTAADGVNCTDTSRLECNDAGTSAVRDAQHLADLGTVFAVTSAALFASAAVVYVTAPRGRIYVRPQASQHGAALVFSGSF